MNAFSGSADAVTVSTIVTAVVIFFAGEMLPKSIAKKYPERLAKATAPSLRFFMFLFWPVSSLLALIGRAASALTPGEPEISVTEDELYDIIEDMTEEGSLDAVRLVAEPDLVEIKLEDLLLREDLLDVDGDEDFLDLALDGLLVGEEEVPCHLLGYGARALAYPS